MMMMSSTINPTTTAPMGGVTQLPGANNIVPFGTPQGGGGGVTQMPGANNIVPFGTSQGGGVANAPVGLQGQSTAGFGPSYGYNPYPSPYPTGLPGSNITSMMSPYGYGGGYGGGAFAGGYAGSYGGGGYGNMMGMGNPYGGFQNATGTGGLNPNTGLATGYGFESAVAPTVFQGSLSGDGTLPAVHPGRIAQEFVGRENGQNKANDIGLASGVIVGAALGYGPWTPKWFKGAPRLAFAFAVGTAAFFTAKFATQPSLETLSKQVYLAKDYASNGHIDSDDLVKNNFDPDLELFNHFI